MRVLQIASVFPPAYAYGGPAIVAYEISKELVKKGHEVTGYTTDVYDAHSRFKYDTNPMWVDGIEVYHFKTVSNKLAHRKNLATAPMMALALNRNIKDFDIVHLHEYLSFQAILVHHYAKKYGVPYVLQAHGSVLPIFQKQNLKKLYNWVCGYKLLKGASKVIALTNTEAEQYKKMGVDEDKIEIMPNGIDLSEYENLPKRGEFRKMYSIRDDAKIVLYVGRLHKSKCIDLLVKAFADISKEVNGVKLVLLGPDDGYRSALEELIQSLKVDDKVLFTGFVTNEEKMAAFVDADVFVNPRADEIFGIVFLEACACGVPVICSRGCGIADTIDGKTGFAVPYGKDQLRDAMIKVLSDEGLRKRFGMDGKRLVREEFKWGKIVLDVEKIYLSVIER